MFYVPNSTIHIHVVGVAQCSHSLSRKDCKTGLNNVCACAISHDNKAKFSARTWSVVRCEVPKTHCQQQWSKGVLFLHSTSTVPAFASQTIIWIRTSWILTFWARSVWWDMNYDLLCLRISSVVTQAFAQVSSSNNRSGLRRSKAWAKKIVMIHWQRNGSAMEAKTSDTWGKNVMKL